MLEVRDVTVQFGPLNALHKVNLKVGQGQIVGLIGPNGSGKTTLFDVIAGVIKPNKGQVLLNGNDVTSHSVPQRARAGIGRTFEQLETFENLSALDNVRVAIEACSQRSALSSTDEAHFLLARLGIGALAEEHAAGLPTGSMRRLELARALAIKPKILLLDECSSGLNNEETAAMAALISEIADDGIAVLVVEHDLRFVMSTCERVTVLNFGEVIAEGTPTEVQANPEVQAFYMGAGLNT